MGKPIYQIARPLIKQQKLRQCDIDPKREKQNETEQ